MESFDSTAIILRRAAVRRIPSEDPSETAQLVISVRQPMPFVRSPFHHTYRPQLDYFSGDACIMDNINHFTNVFVCFRHLFG